MAPARDCQRPAAHVGDTHQSRVFGESLKSKKATEGNPVRHETCRPRWPVLESCCFEGDTSVRCGSGCPCPVAGHSLRPSRPSLVRSCLRSAIHGSAGQLRRLSGHGHPSRNIAWGCDLERAEEHLDQLAASTPVPPPASGPCPVRSPAAQGTTSISLPELPVCRGPSIGSKHRAEQDCQGGLFPRAASGPGRPAAGAGAVCS
jgi:hypothetical protein